MAAEEGGLSRTRTAVASKMTSSGRRGRPRELPEQPEDGNIELELGVLKVETFHFFSFSLDDSTGEGHTGQKTTFIHLSIDIC